MNPEALERLLTEVQKGTLPVKAAIGQLRTLPYEDLGFASVGHYGRGFPRSSSARERRRPRFALSRRHC